MHKAGGSLPGGALRVIGMSSNTTTHQTEPDWQSRSGEYAEWSREIASELGETVEQHIRAQPLTAVLIAGGVGFLLGWFSTRRS